MVAQEITSRPDFEVVDGGAGVNPGFEALDQPFC